MLRALRLQLRIRRCPLLRGIFRLRDIGPQLQRALLCRLGAVFVLIGCSVPVARNLDELSANRVAVALDRAGVTSTKEFDAQNEGKWLIFVHRAQAPLALEVLSREGLPVRERPGVAESVAQDSLVPSLQSERARLLAGTAGDLERTLASIDGVASARVHLAVPASDLLIEAADRAVPSASVLIRYHGQDLPVAPEAIQQLVAGAVANLNPNHVAVVATRVAEMAANHRKMVPLGPFSVAQESAIGLRIVVGGLAGLNLLMLALVLNFWQKIRVKRLGRTSKVQTSSAESW